MPARTVKIPVLSTPRLLLRALTAKDAAACTHDFRIFGRIAGNP